MTEKTPLLWVRRHVGDEVEDGCGRQRGRLIG